MSDADLAALNDHELAERARKVHETLTSLPRDHASRDSYIISWRLCINELNRRSLPDPVEYQLSTREPGASKFAPAPAPGGFYPTKPSACG
jgi:hypothetical protein